jgi:hypothetical protein
LSGDDDVRKIRAKKLRTDIGKYSFVNRAINPYPANVENMVSSLIMPENGRWDLIRR